MQFAYSSFKMNIYEAQAFYVKQSHKMFKNSLTVKKGLKKNQK